jgi:hypothetical protein
MKKVKFSDKVIIHNLDDTDGLSKISLGNVC